MILKRPVFCIRPLKRRNKWVLNSGTVIGANAAVVSDIGNNVIAGEVPAKVIRERVEGVVTN